MMAMAAIVATLLYVPVGALLAAFCSGVLGISLHSLVTFGATFNPVPGLIVWWLVGFVPGLGYAALMMR
jgi:hypothetical protein